MSESESELFSIHNFTLTFNRVSYLKWISFSDVQHPPLFMIRVFYFQHDPESSRGYLRSQVDGGTRWHSKHNLSWTWRRVTSWKKRTTINQYSSTIKPLSLDSKRIWKAIKPDWLRTFLWVGTDRSMPRNWSNKLVTVIKISYWPHPSSKDNDLCELLLNYKRSVNMVIGHLEIITINKRCEQIDSLKTLKLFLFGYFPVN